MSDKSRILETDRDLTEVSPKVSLLLHYIQLLCLKGLTLLAVFQFQADLDRVSVAGSIAKKDEGVRIKLV